MRSAPLNSTLQCRMHPRENVRRPHPSHRQGSLHRCWDALCARKHRVWCDSYPFMHHWTKQSHFAVVMWWCGDVMWCGDVVMWGCGDGVMYCCCDILFLWCIVLVILVIYYCCDVLLWWCIALVMYCCCDVLFWWCIVVVMYCWRLLFSY